MPHHAVAPAGIGLGGESGRATGARRSRWNGATRPELAAIAILLLLFPGGCGDPPALEVGRVGYSAEELGVLGATQRRTLADLTAFGLTVADQRLDEVARPFVERELRSLVLQRLAMEVAVEDAGMDEAELRLAYSRDPQLELVVRHLVVLSERWRPESHRDSTRARAVEALRRARAGEPFETLVREYSDEPGARERGGLLQPGREGSWAPEFWRAASSLSEGEVSDVVETEYGFHVVRLEERRVVPFEEVRGDVLQQFVDLPQALARADEWADMQAGRMVVDTPTILEWARGDTTDRVVVRWPEASGVEPHRTTDLDRLLATYNPENAAAIRQVDRDATIRFAEATARNEVLLGIAAQRGIATSAAQRAALERRWSERLAGWAAAFEFEPGLPADRIKVLALAGLGGMQQQVLRARSELRTVSTRLRQLYPVRAPPVPSPDAVETPSP